MNILGRNWKRWSRTKLWFKIVVGLVLGVLAGLVFGESAGVLKPIGTIFINAIKMLVVPLILFTLISGVTSMDDTAKMGRVGAKAFGLYLFTTAIAVSIGLAVASLIRPGAGINLEAPATASAKEAPSLIDMIVNMVPANPVASLANADVLQIIVFSLLVGVAMNLIGEKARPITNVVNAGAEVMYKLTHMVMEIAPYGVFALMAWVSGQYGLDVLLPLAKLVGATYLACILHIIITYGGLLVLAGRLNPLPFLRGILDAQAISFTTASSSATLPVTLSCVQDNLGVSKSVSSFVLPLGATINMDGTALYQALAALFVAQAFGIDLNFAQYTTIVFTATLVSIGAAGIPGAGLIMMTMVFGAVGLPMEGIAIVAGIDRILDMMRTMTNVTGDATVTVLVAKSEGELDETVYNARPEI